MIVDLEEARDIKKITILPIALMVIIVGFLSGCNEEQNVDESNFIGSWSSVKFSAEYIENVSEFNITMTFFINNTVETVTTYPGDVIKTLSEYKVEKDKLYFTPMGELYNFSEIYNYKFSHGGNRLTLDYPGVVYIVLDRI